MASIGTPALAQPVPYADLLAQPEFATERFFPLDDSDSTMRDLSPASQNGTYVGSPALGVEGPLFGLPTGGRAARFDGTTSHGSFDLPSLGSELGSAEGVTIIAWFRTSSSAAGTLIGSYNHATRLHGFEIGLGKSQYIGQPSMEHIAFAVSQASGVYRSASILVPSWNDGDWHMIACAYRGETITMWYDGLPQMTTTASAGTTGAYEELAGPVAIGCAQEAQGTSSSKSADVALVSVHGHLLDDDLVRSLWESGQGYTGQAVYRVENVLPWVESARSARADVALIGDSNTIITVEGGLSGHFVGFSRALRDRLPIYASAVLPGRGTTGWANTFNGIAPFIANTIGTGPFPGFIDSQVPPVSAGFPTAIAYASDSESIPASNAWRAAINWDSPDMLFDFSRDVDFHFTYATFAEGSGVIRPRVQLFYSPFTPIGSATEVTAPIADAVIDSTFRIPAGPRSPGQPYTIQLNDYANGLSAEGPFALMYCRFVLPGVTTGVSLTPLWAVGGQSGRYAADRFTNYASLEQIGAYLRQIVRQQTPGQERLLVHIMEGGNDANDNRDAISEDGSTVPLRSSSKTGQKLNTQTLITRIRSAWIARGFDPLRLHFLLGPYHPAENSGPRVRYWYVRAWRELANEHPDWNITIMDGFGISSVAEFTANGWYDPASGQPHLSQAGYIAYGNLVWQGLFDAVAANAGACCDGTDCHLMLPSQCAATFKGLGSVCGASDNRLACCPANFNGQNGLTVQDIFDFMAAYFAQDPRADINASGAISVQDIFDFLAAYFAGC